MPNLPGGPVEAAGTAYREAKADAFYESTLRLKRRRLAREADDLNRARLRAVSDELRRRGYEVAQ